MDRFAMKIPRLAFFRELMSWLVVLMVGPIGASEAIDRTFATNHHLKSTPRTNPYGLLDLDTDIVSPKYTYSRWGNRLSSTSGAKREFEYNGLTRGAVDLFVVSSKTSLGDETIVFDGARVAPDIRAFPASAQWQPGILKGVGPGSVVLYPALSGTMPEEWHLLRRLHFPRDLFDHSAGKVIAPGSHQPRKLVVLIHGWNANSGSNGYGGPEFVALVEALKQELKDEGWALNTVST